MSMLSVHTQLIQQNLLMVVMFSIYLACPDGREFMPPRTRTQGLKFWSECRDVLRAWLLGAMSLLLLTKYLI